MQSIEDLKRQALLKELEQVDSNSVRASEIREELQEINQPSEEGLAAYNKAMEGLHSVG